MEAEQAEQSLQSISTLEQIADHVETILTELIGIGKIEIGQIIVIGTSTSEVIGKHIGTAGSEAVAERIFEGMSRVRKHNHFYPAFQCCEHLNRALVVEKELIVQYPFFEQVSVIPIPKAGGAMGAYAFKNFQHPMMIETIQAHGGLDIGGTLIGMHLRRVAVPVKPSIRTIGQASVQMAYTRPKLIGGTRAVYTDQANHSLTCE
jgi:uncharacterized protein (TIGR01440 family)